MAKKRYKRNLNFAFFFTMLAVSFVFINIVSAVLFGGMKLDVTKDKKFELSSYSKDIIKSIEEPIRVRVYLSSDLGSTYPGLSLYSQFVIRQLDKYKDLSEGKISIEIVNPKPYSLEENEAIEAGMKPMLDKSGKNNVYFGAVFADGKGHKRIMPAFISQREAYLEYDLSRLLNQMVNGKKKIGVVAASKFYNGYTAKVLKSEYRVETISPDILQVPVDIKTLLVVAPRDVSDFFIYALDQYVLRGGNLILLVDPLSENKAQMKSSLTYGGGRVAEFLNNLGIKYDAEMVVGDELLAESTMIDNKVQRYYPWISVNEDYIIGSDVTNGIRNLSFKSAGALEVEDDDRIKSIIKTSDRAGFMPTIAAEIGKQRAIDSFEPAGRALDLAVFAEGEFSSMFEENIISKDSKIRDLLPFISASLWPAKVFVIADADFIFDEAYANVALTKYNEIYGAFNLNNNLDFLLRMIDLLSDNKAIFPLSSKKAAGQQMSIMDVIDSAIYNKYQDQYSLTNKELLEVEQEIVQMNDDIENRRVSFSLSFAKKLQQNEEKATALIKTLRSLDYKMLKNRETKVNGIIVLNMFIIPGIILLLLMLLSFTVTFKNKRKAMELVNEKR